MNEMDCLISYQKLDIDQFLKQSLFKMKQNGKTLDDRK